MNSFPRTSELFFYIVNSEQDDHSLVQGSIFSYVTSKSCYFLYNLVEQKIYKMILDVKLVLNRLLTLLADSLRVRLSYSSCTHKESADSAQPIFKVKFLALFHPNPSIF